MLLKECNEVLKTSEKIGKELKVLGYNNKISIYINGGNKGVSIIILDKDDRVFNTYYTGSSDKAFELITKLYLLKERIMNEC